MMSLDGCCDNTCLPRDLESSGAWLVLVGGGVKACAPAPQAQVQDLHLKWFYVLTGSFLLNPPFPPQPHLGCSWGEGAALTLQSHSASTRVVNSSVLQTLGWWAVVPVLFK